MLFYLNIEQLYGDNFLGKIKNIFKRNKIEISEQKVDKVHLVTINVSLFKKKIPWKKIVEILGKNKKVLCSEQLKIPREIEIERYESDKLNTILCKNAALEILRKANITKENYKLVLYDPHGNHVEFLSRVINFSRNIIVISDEKNLYEKEQHQLLKKCGVSILVTENREWTYGGNCIIAPDKIVEPLQTSFDSFIFSGAKNKYNINGRIYDDYNVEYNKYKLLNPPDLDMNYFLNVIYDKYGLKSFETLLPESCCYCGEKFSLKHISESFQ